MLCVRSLLRLGKNVNGARVHSTECRLLLNAPFPCAERNLESLDEFTGTYFAGAPNVSTLPLLLYTAGAGGTYQIASITALILLVPSIAFMFVVERFLRADVLAQVGR